MDRVIHRWERERLFPFRWDGFTCAKMKEGIVVGCLLKVVAMASDDEGFTLSVTSKLT